MGITHVDNLIQPDKNGELYKARGIHWALAALFIVADTAGAGLVALPAAVVRCQIYAGLAVILITALLVTVSGVMLGRCWLVLLRRFPVYRTHCRKPYPEIALRAMGPTMRWIASFFVNLMQFGTSTIFLLLSAKNIQDFVLAYFGRYISFCSIALMVAVLLFPITLFKSPQDFWPVVVIGMLSTAVTCLFICIGVWMDIGECAPRAVQADFHSSNYMVALGTILFTLGGASTFPTIQNDMRRPAQFGLAVNVANAFIIVLYVATGMSGGLAYGTSVLDSVVNSIQTKWIQQVANMVIVLHCLMTLPLYINTLNQEVEDAMGVPQEFCTKRVLVRSAVFALVVLVAETVPTFGPVVDVIGGTAVTATSIVLPCLFYLYLNAWETKTFGVCVSKTNATNENETEEKATNKSNNSFYTTTSTDESVSEPLASFRE